MNQININEILGHLPHRYPFILIDRVLDFQPNERLLALKNVTINEPFFTGHFPGQPIMPGVLILEALAQACVILAHKSMEQPAGKSILHLFAGVDNARFKQLVTPGDQLHLEVNFVSHKRGIWRMHGEASVDSKTVCVADFLSAAKEFNS